MLSIIFHDSDANPLYTAHSQKKSSNCMRQTRSEREITCREPDAKSGLTLEAEHSRIQMKLFSLGQRWVATDALFGTSFGEVVEVSGEGRSGVVVITDDRGNVLDTFSGSAEDFQTSGDWQLIN